MGTSAASKGPSAGVSFDPPWLDDDGGFTPIETAPQHQGETTDADEQGDDDADGDISEGAVENPSVAPAARFSKARSRLSEYAKESSGRTGFEKAAGHYSKTGMGGASRLASRMRHSTANGARLAEFLTATSSQSDPTATAWVKEIGDRGLKGQEVIDAIIQHVAPSNGSRDEESSSDSMARALSEFLANNEDSDLFALGAGEIREITERYLANEACNRLVNDIGQIFESGKISLKDSIALLNEMREYLRADLSVQIEGLWNLTANPTSIQLSDILRLAIQHTFSVYEGEI